LGNWVIDIEDWRIGELVVAWHQFCVSSVFVSEEAERLKERTMRFALDVCALIKQLPHFEPGPTVRHQLAKAATSVAFNYRASCRARSHSEFTAKIGLVAKEADESQGWLEFIEAAKLIVSTEVTRLVRESTELVAIFSASVGTARNNQRGSR
jgi:four helix bundle protein